MNSKTKTFGQIFRFGVQNFVSYLLQMFFLWAFHDHIGLSETNAFGLNLILIFIINFVILVKFTFPDTLKRKEMSRVLLGVIKISIIMRILEYALFAALLPYFESYLICATAILVTTNVIKFVLYRNITN